VAEAKLKIALFAPALPGSGAINGIVTYTGIMRDALRALGHSVIVLAGDRIEHSDGRVGAIARPNRALGAYRRLVESRQPDDGSSVGIRLQILNAFRAARREGAEIFEIEESFGWAGRLVGRGAAVVTRLHGPHVFGREPQESADEKMLGDLRETAEARALTKVQAVSCPSDRLLDAIISRYDFKLPLARAIPNPISVPPKSARWSAAKADLDQLLCVGRFDLRKGADVVLRGFARALEQRPSLRLVMVGPDPGLTQPDGSRIHFDQFITSEVPSLAKERITYLGPQSPQQIARLRQKSAFAIVGSRFENFPYSIAEAVAVGMPVLASDSFGNAEIIRDGLDGRIVPMGDVAATAEAIVAMSSNPARLAAMGHSAYARAAEWLAPDRIARETADLYRAALARL
jgi:glycosyltransferase involved in cell wall biosynthesis